MTVVSHAEIVESLITGGCVVLLGGIDTGKTTFGLSVAEAGRQRGLRVAYVDAAIDNSTVGPPGCVGLKFCEDLEHVDEQSIGRADALAFVGSITPQGHAFALATLCSSTCSRSSQNLRPTQPGGPTVELSMAAST